MPADPFDEVRAEVGRSLASVQHLHGRQKRQDFVVEMKVLNKLRRVCTSHMGSSRLVLSLEVAAFHGSTALEGLP